MDEKSITVGEVANPTITEGFVTSGIVTSGIATSGIATSGIMTTSESCGTTLSVLSGSSSGLSWSPGTTITPYTSSPLPYAPYAPLPPYSLNEGIETTESSITQLMKAQNEAKIDVLEDVYADLENVTTDIGLINFISKLEGKIRRLKNFNL